MLCTFALVFFKEPAQYSIYDKWCMLVLAGVSANAGSYYLYQIIHWLYIPAQIFIICHEILSVSIRKPIKIHIRLNTRGFDHLLVLSSLLLFVSLTNNMFMFDNNTMDKVMALNLGAKSKSCQELQSSTELHQLERACNTFLLDDDTVFCTLRGEYSKTEAGTRRLMVYVYSDMYSTYCNAYLDDLMMLIKQKQFDVVCIPESMLSIDKLLEFISEAKHFGYEYRMSDVFILGSSLNFNKTIETMALSCCEDNIAGMVFLSPDIVLDADRIVGVQPVKMPIKVIFAEFENDIERKRSYLDDLKGRGANIDYLVKEGMYPNFLFIPAVTQGGLTTYQKEMFNHLKIFVQDIIP